MGEAFSSLRAQLDGKLDAAAADNGPPAQWQPPLRGQIDISIDARGQWWHGGDLIRRAGLVRLFTTILRREGEDYVLVTPVEKWRITVEDLPFVAVEVKMIEGAPWLTDQHGTSFALGAAHPLYLGSLDAPRPWALRRAGLGARVSRACFIDIAERLEEDSAGQLWLGSYPLPAAD